ncbi:MAG: PAS domain S-box protein [Leptolyngbyaceae cyanobacterium]
MVSSSPKLDISLAGSAVTEAIIPNPLVVAPDTPLMAVIAAMSQTPLNTCLVSAEAATTQPQAISASCAIVAVEGQVVGICTERDVVRLAAQGRSPRDLTVAEVMTKTVMTKTVDQLSDVLGTLQFMQQQRIRHLPVVDQQGQLLGVVTPHSLRQLLKLMDLLRLRQIEEVMETEVVQAESTTSVLRVAQQMAEQPVSCVVIVAVARPGQTRPLGIMTERDIVQLQSLELDLAKVSAADVMSTPLQCLQPGDTLWAAHQLMQAKRIRRLVITDAQGALAGLVTQTSMLQLFNTADLYDTLDLLQQRIQALENEKLALLLGRNLTLEQQAAERIAELQKRAEREQFLATFSRQVSQSFDFLTILTAAVQQVRAFLRCDRVLVYRFGADLRGQVIAEAVNPNFQVTLGSYYEDVCFPRWLEADYLDGCQRHVDNIYQANLQDCHIEFLESLQVKGYLISPIVTKGQLWGLLVLHHCVAPRPWQQLDLSLIDHLSAQLAIAIQQGQLYEQAQIEIQERQQAELKLQQERNFANAIVNAAGALVVVSDADGCIVQFNQTCQRLTGYTAAEAQGRPVWDFLIPPEEGDRVRQHIQAVLTHPQADFPDVSENHWLTKAGDRRLIAWTNSTLLDAQGQVEYMIGTGIDVTEARQAETALRQSEATNRALLEAIPDLIIRLQRDGTYLDCLPARDDNPISLFERPDSWSIFDVLPPNIAQEYRRQIEGAFTTGQPQTYEYEFEIDGQVFYQEARIAISGVDEALLIVRDISQRKRSELAHRQAETALHNVVEGTAAVIGEHFFDALVTYLATALDVCHAMVTIYEGDRLQTLASYSRGELRPSFCYETPGLPCELTLQQHTYACVQGLRTQFPDERLTPFAAESYVGLALLDTAGRPIGTLCVLDTQAIANLSQVEKILKVFAARAAAEIERLQTMAALEQLNEQLELRVAARTQELSDSNVALLESNVALLHSQEQLRRSEDLLRLTFDNAPIGIVTADLAGRFLMVNAAFHKMLGYTSEEVMEQTFLGLTDPDDRAASRHAFDQLLTSKTGAVTLENRYAHKDGTAVDAIAHISVVKDLDGQPLYLVGQIEDIREWKRAEAERTRLLRMLEASLNEIFIFDPETLRFSYVNQGALNNLGYTLPQLQAMTPVDIKPQMTTADFEAMIAPLRQCKTDKVNFEAIHQRADGTQYAADIHLQLIELGDERLFLAVILDITDRKRADEQIHRQLLAMETAIEGMAILRDCRHCYLNQAYAQLFGYETADELLDQPWAKLYSTAENKRFQTEIFPALEAQGHWQGEAIATRKDGSTFYEELSLTLSSMGDLICVRRDINDRKQAEVALQESKAVLQDFFDNASDLIQSVSMADGRFIFVNQAWLETLGYTFSELETLTIFDVLAAENLPHCQQLFAAIQQGKCTSLDRIEIVLRTKAGDLVQLEGNINVRIEQGVPVATRGIFRNVTERKQAEQAMKQQLAAIEAASDGIAILNDQGGYVFVNTAYCQLFDMPASELLGKTWCNLYTAAEVARFEQKILPHLVAQGHWRGEAIAVRQDGSEFPQEVSLTQIAGVGLVCVCQDISDRKAAEVEIRRALAAERELNELKSRFVSTTSHEFRTPLGVIASSAGILQDYGDRIGSAKQQKHFMRIQDSVNHMTQLLEDMLILSRAEAGKMQLKYVSTRILDFCQDIVEELNLSTGSDRINIRVDAVPAYPVMVDQRLLRQILTNLLSNALKYSRPESEVYLLLTTHPQSFDILIQDQGIGIPEDDLKHLFQSFHRAQNVGNIPGTGLGLSIVKKLVELHQGKIICQSEVNFGTTFTLRFPLNLPPALYVPEDSAPKRI